MSRPFGSKLTEAHKIKISKSLLGKPLIETHREKIRIALKGKNAKNWIKDRSLVINGKAKMSTEYKEWRRSVIVRDGWKCKISNSECCGRLEVHHILSWRSYLEFRYEINNGITLCHKHHPLKKKDEERLSPYFQRLIQTI